MIAVTGASGFLGSHILDAFPSDRVVAVARRAVHLPVVRRTADLRDCSSLEDAFSGCAVVVANAALAPGGRSVTEADLREANLQGTQNTLDAAIAAGVRRVGLVSTIAVYASRFGATLTEDSALRDPADRSWDFTALTTNPAYARTKAAGEALAWAYRDRVELVVVRPGPIYGPRDHKLTLRYIRWAQSRRRLLPGIVLPHAYAPDVADLIARCATDAPAGAVYNCGGHSLSPAAVVAALGQHRVWAIPLPTPVVVDDRKAQQELGWKPAPVHSALDDCRTWMMAQA